MNLSNETLAQLDVLYVTIGMAHVLLVIAPTLLLGSIVLSIFISNKKLRDPVSIVFIFTSFWSILGPVTYGFLMDLSLFTDIEVIGSCKNYSSRIFWVLFGTFQVGLLMDVSYLSIVHYSTVRWGVKKVPLKATIVVLSVSLTFCLLGCTFHFIGPSSLVRLKGSLCLHPSTIRDTVIIGVSALLLFSLPISVIVGVFSCLTIRYVKKNTISSTNLVKSVTRIIITWTIFTSICQLLPLTAFLSRALAQGKLHAYTAALLFIYAVELSHPVFQLLVLLLHKTVREIFIGKCKKIKQRLCQRNVATTTEATQRVE